MVRLNHEIIRLVYNGEAYFAECIQEGKHYHAVVKEKDDRINELPVSLTLVPALIRREKFELVLQKAAEMGVSRIVPLESSRCVVHAKKEGREKLLARWHQIVTEASAQCKRNFIPEVTDVISFSDLNKVKSEVNCAPYENAWGTSRFLSEAVQGAKSVTAVIGPEGGFSEEEMQWFKANGYEAVTLGSRILRAETAAMYTCAVIGETAERNRKK